MALPSLAPVSALETRLGLAPGTLADADLARAEDDLADVSALIRAEAGTDWVADDGATIIAPDVVVTVAVRAAKRSYLNPEDLTQEGVGDYNAARGQVGVYLTAEERRIVVRAAENPRGGVFTGTVRTPSSYGEPDRSTDRYFWGLE